MVARETYGVKKGVALDLWCAAAGVVDVVVLEGDQVAGAVKVHSPVSVAVTGCRVIGCSVNVAVGDGDTAGRFSTEDNMLTTDSGSLTQDDCQ